MSVTVLNILERSFCGENLKSNNDSNAKQRKKFPYDIISVDEKINRELLKDFKGEKTGFVQVGPKKWFFPSGYAKDAEKYYNFEPRPDDIWIVTYPRSGTTWSQEMVWLLANNLDYERAAKIPLVDRFPFLEWTSFIHDETLKEFLDDNKHSPENVELLKNIATPVYSTLKTWKQRRFIKTHLPLDLLPPNLLKIGCKVIYIARNPKDVAVSFFHLNRLIRTQGYIGNFEKYWDYFQNGYQAWAPYWEHIKDAWELKNEKNLLFMFYEDMAKDKSRSGIEKISAFLNQSYSKTELDTLEEHLKFENFQNNKSVNMDLYKKLGILKTGEQGFIRKGKSGGWKDYFTGELNKKADKWIEENLKTTDLRFPLVK